MARLADKVAIVTGAGSGIGTATVRKFAAEGATVVATDVDAAAGSAVVAEIGANAVFLRHDVTDEGRWEAVMKEAADRCGAVDVVVNNAGIIGTGAPQTPEDLSLDEMHAIGKVNVDGVLLGCKHAIRAMKERGGAIVNLSSIAGIYATPGLTPYGASKGAVRQLTKSVAAYCGQRGYGIRCNSVHPGIVETPMGETVLNFLYDDPEQGREERRRGVPVGRLGRPEDIANAVCYLASDEAGFVNGAELVVDGGQLIL